MKTVLQLVSLFASCVAGFAFTADDVALTVTTDGSYQDVTNGIAYAHDKAADGWTVIVGSAAGSYTWTNVVNINITHTFTLRGASSSTRATVTSTYTGGFGISITATEGKTITVRDLIFEEWSDVNGLFIINGSGTNCFRLSNLKFNHGSGTACAWISDLNSRSGEGPYGVIDHCEIASSGASGYGFYIRENTLSDSWQNAMTMGTVKAVYIEDCSFHAATVVAGIPAVDSDNGGRLVVRHCTLTNFSLGTHGADSGGPTNSVLQFEIMQNTFCVTGGQGLVWCMLVRGGTGVMFSNTVTQTDSSFYNCVLSLAYYRAAPGNGVVTVDRFYPADYLGTQQPGMGVSVGASSADPNFPAMPWVSLPIYNWGNTISAPLNFGEVCSGVTADDAAFMQINRDYFNGTPKPGYTTFTYPHPLSSDSGGGGGDGGVAGDQKRGKPGRAVGRRSI